ncbi:LysR family transcriptional regulator [Aliamphritea spongicola]|nr:LysR family transcriptional regulator [Aliamphritea spongicola]
MNINALTLKQLRAFTSVARLGTLTAAAEELSLTKGALSVALHELEKQLGHPLFDRVKNRLVMNAYGQQLRPLADELLQRTMTIESLFGQGTWPVPCILAPVTPWVNTYCQCWWVTLCSAMNASGRI